MSIKTYCQYFKAGGGYLFTALAFGLYIITEVIIIVVIVYTCDVFYSRQLLLLLTGGLLIGRYMIIMS